jgi:hypothetical protein
MWSAQRPTVYFSLSERDSDSTTCCDTRSLKRGLRPRTLSVDWTPRLPDRRGVWVGGLCENVATVSDNTAVSK